MSVRSTTTIWPGSEGQARASGGALGAELQESCGDGATVGLDFGDMGELLAVAVGELVRVGDAA
jgi:hypothetical protein